MKTTGIARPVRVTPATVQLRCGTPGNPAASGPIRFRTLRCWPGLILFLALLLPGTGHAQFSYVVNGNTVSITGYTGPGGAVTIPAFIGGRAVVEIANNAFYNQSGITQLTLGTNLTRIGQSAFELCGRIPSITIPDSVVNVDTRAFYVCSSLTNVVLGAKVNHVGSNTFHYCDRLAAITVDSRNPVYSSADGVLYNKARTTLLQCPWGRTGHVVVPVGVTALAAFALYQCTNLTRLTCPDSLASVGAGACFGCTGLTNVALGNSIAELGDQAFWYCTSLSHLSLSGPLTRVGNHAFDNCVALTTLTLPATVNELGEGAFESCESMTSLVLPENLARIGSFAFQDCHSLTNLVLPDGVAVLGSSAFRYCTNLASVSLGTNLNALGGSTFWFCSRLEQISLPARVEFIGDQAFYECTNLASVTVGRSVAFVGNYSFFHCGRLTNISLPRAVTRVGEGAFYACAGLQSVYFSGNAPSLGPDAFGGAQPVIHYLPGTSGWGPLFGGRPTALWRPEILTGDGRFGLGTNGFGFTISWADGMVYKVEAAANLTSPVWVPLATNSLSGDTASFADPHWAGHRSRVYRVRWP